MTSANATSAELTIVAPTFNERENVAELVSRLDRALEGVRWEIVFVDDDSNDGTIGALRTLAQNDPRVRAIHRIGRRGLSSAVVEGVLASSSPYIAVMDADLQHDETLLPQMLACLRAGEADVVIGSRYAEGGGTGDWSASRRGMSRFASAAARMITPTPLTDPMSGFFMLTRPAFEGAMRGLSAQGFKILLDILATARGKLRVIELPYTFRNREHGESKLDSGVVWDYFALLLDKTIGRVVPTRFVLFALVGGIGVIIHMGTLAALMSTFGLSFLVSQAGATFGAMTFNFALNNKLTYRDQRLRGARLLTGLLSFYAICAVGAVANVGIANYLFGQASQAWWLAGLAGVLVGAVWNFSVSAAFTWRVR